MKKVIDNRMGYSPFGVDLLKKLSVNAFAIAILTIMSIVMPLTSCSDSKWGDLPSSIANFISEYFPSSSVESYSENNGQYYVKIKNGPSIKFDSSCAWCSIDGEGAALPQVLLFDELPPALYQYLEETESLNSVYELDRDALQYEVGLFDTALTYTISTGEIHTAD